MALHTIGRFHGANVRHLTGPARYLTVTAAPDRTQISATDPAATVTVNVDAHTHTPGTAVIERAALTDAATGRTGPITILGGQCTEPAGTAPAAPVLVAAQHPPLRDHHKPCPADETLYADAVQLLGRVAAAAEPNPPETRPELGCVHLDPAALGTNVTATNMLHGIVGTIPAMGLRGLIPARIAHAVAHDSAGSIALGRHNTTWTCTYQQSGASRSQHTVTLVFNAPKPARAFPDVQRAVARLPVPDLNATVNTSAFQEALAELTEGHTPHQTVLVRATTDALHLSCSKDRHVSIPATGGGKPVRVRCNARYLMSAVAALDTTVATAAVRTSGPLTLTSRETRTVGLVAATPEP